MKVTTAIEEYNPEEAETLPCKGKSSNYVVIMGKMIRLSDGAELSKAEDENAPWCLVDLWNALHERDKALYE